MQVTRSILTELITRGDAVSMNAVGRALVHLLHRQTQQEAQYNNTTVANARGFTPGDAYYGSIHAKYFQKNKYLQHWQINYWLRPNAQGVPRLSKYWAQINEEAQKRAVAKLMT